MIDMYSYTINIFELIYSQNQYTPHHILIELLLKKSGFFQFHVYLATDEFSDKNL